MSAQHCHFNKTRIAPTPSGYLHLGNILSFAITAAIARKTNAKILLRIDDMDRHRISQYKLHVQDIFDTLNFLEIPWDEGPRNMEEYEQEYSQLHRMEMYEKAIEHLKNEGVLFACTCTRTQVQNAHPEGIYTGICSQKNIPLNTLETSWRMDTSNAEQLTVTTFNQGVRLEEFPYEMRDFIIKKKDNTPAYQLTSLLDDIYFGVDLVVRGQDLWNSTLAQLHLAKHLPNNNFHKTTFVHHPLLIGADGKKLSKTAGATSVHYLKNQNKKKADIYLLIGNILGIKTPVENWEQLVNSLNLDLIQSS